MLTKLSHLYNPSIQSDQEIKDNFVIRQEEYNLILNDIKKESIQNFLLIAQRGMGKTSLLLRLKYEIDYNPLFADSVPIQLKEEQYNIFSLCNLWEVIADELDGKDGFEGIGEQLNETIDDGIDDCFKIILEALKENKKRLILLVDNFGDMLEKFTDIELDELKEILDNKHLQIISASSRVFEPSSKYNESFFKDFKIITLKGLDREETETLLSSSYTTKIKNAQEIVENKSSQIEIIRRLTGGVPRTMILLFGIFSDENANVFDDLEHTLDTVTPLYKHRMDDLSPQEQKISHEMALAWDGVTFDELKNKVRIEEKELHRNLLSLEKNSLVNIEHIEGNGDIYQLRERFFNIWYLMRYGRSKNKENIKWLVKFLQVWCTPEELKDRAYKHIQRLQDGGMNPRGAKHLADALADTISDEMLKYQLRIELKKYSKINNVDAVEEKDFEGKDFSFEDKVNYYEEAIKANPEHISFYNSLGNIYRQEGEYEKAKKYYEQVVQIDSENTTAYMGLGILYLFQKNYKKAIVYYNKVIKIDSKNTSAYTNIGHCYTSIKDYEKAMEYYNEAIKIDSKHLIPYIGIGHNYRAQKDYEKSIEYYNKAIKINSKYIYAYDAIGNIYEIQQNYEKAIEYYKKIIEIDSEYAYAYDTLGEIYNTLEEYEEAIKYYKKAIEIDSEYTSPYFSLGIIYFNLEKYDKAIEYFEKNIEIEPNNSHVLNNLGFIYKHKKNHNKAIKYYQKAIEVNSKYTVAYINWAILEKDSNVAIDLMEKAIEICPNIYKEIIDIMFYAEDDKEKTINLVDEALKLEENEHTNWIKAILRVWGKKYQESITYFREALSCEDEDNKEDITKYILLLISARQYYLVNDLFNDKKLNLKNKFRPLYYTLMYFMQKEYPQEYKRMGEELRETVEELINEVNTLENVFDNDEEEFKSEEKIDTEDILEKLKSSPSDYFHDAISYVEKHSEKSKSYVELLDEVAGLYDQAFLNKNDKFNTEWDRVSLPLYLKAIEIRKKLFGKNDASVAESYIDLADIIKHSSASSKNSTHYYLEAIEIMENSLKKNNFNKETFNRINSLMKSIDKLFFINSENSNHNLKFRIDKIEIENFKQYKTPFIMEFSEKVNIVIGQNAVGKTSLLQAITLALLEKNSFDRVEDNDYSPYITKGKDDAKIIISYNNGKKVLKIKKDRREIDDNFFIPFVLTYGSNFFANRDINPNKIVDAILNENIHKEFANTIFKDFTDEFWSPLGILEDLALSSHKKAKEKERLLFKTINEFLEFEPFTLYKDERDSRYYYYFKKDNNKVEYLLSDLSEGYRGNILLVTDMMIKILGVGWTPNTIEGIVLIDEFDKHLHPRWQSKLVDKLTDIFKNIQFIMTTHNPMSILGRKAEEITILDEVDGKIEAVRDSGTENIDIGMVLLKYFHVDSIVGATMRNNLNEITEIKLKGRRRLTKDDRERIKELEEELQYTPATDFIYNRAYFNFLVFVKENKNIDFNNYESLKDEEMLNIMEEYKGLF